MRKYVVLVLVLAVLLSAFARADYGTTPDWEGEILRVPDGVETIEESAFEGITSTSVVLPRSLLTVGANAFADCEYLERICILSSNAVFEANALGTSNEPKEIWGYAGSTAEAYAQSYGYTFVRINRYEDELIDYAATKLGTKYIRGTWDCVLFVRHCYKVVLNITLPDTCRAMEKLNESSLIRNQHLTVTRINNINDLKKGDVICWCNDEVSYCTHVGMYVGEGTVNGRHYNKGVFIENSSGAGKVRYNYIPATGTGYYTRNFICAWRII